MDSFEYLSVLISVIVGLAVTQILQGMRALMLARSNARLYAPPLIWAMILLVVAIQMWWTMFGLREQTDWTFGMYAIVLLQTALLYLASGLILPDVTSEGIDLRQSYYANAPWFFSLLAATAIASIAKELVIQGRLPVAVNLGFHAALIITSTVAALVRARWYHVALAPVMAIGFVVYIALLFAHL